MSGKNKFESGVGLHIPGEGYIRVTATSPGLQEILDGITPLAGTFEERLAALTARIDGKKPGGNVWTSPSGMMCAEKEYGSDVVQRLVNDGRLSF